MAICTDVMRVSIGECDEAMNGEYIERFCPHLLQANRFRQLHSFVLDQVERTL